MTLRASLQRVQPFSQRKNLNIVNLHNTLGSKRYFFLIDTDRSWQSRVNEAHRQSAKRRAPYQTVSTVYFILGILRTDLWSQGTSTNGHLSQSIYWLQFNPLYNGMRHYSASPTAKITSRKQPVFQRLTNKIRNGYEINFDPYGALIIAAILFIVFHIMLLQ